MDRTEVRKKNDAMKKRRKVNIWDCVVQEQKSSSLNYKKRKTTGIEMNSQNVKMQCEERNKKKHKATDGKKNNSAADDMLGPAP